MIFEKNIKNLNNKKIFDQRSPAKPIKKIPLPPGPSTTTKQDLKGYFHQNFSSFCIYVQCSTVQRNVVQVSSVQVGAVQSSTVQCSAVVLQY